MIGPATPEVICLGLCCLCSSPQVGQSKSALSL
jgi:hypothetical protein